MSMCSASQDLLSPVEIYGCDRCFSTSRVIRVISSRFPSYKGACSSRVSLTFSKPTKHFWRYFVSWISTLADFILHLNLLSSLHLFRESHSHVLFLLVAEVTSVVSSFAPDLISGIPRPGISHPWDISRSTVSKNHASTNVRHIADAHQTFVLLC